MLFCVCISRDESTFKMLVMGAGRIFYTFAAIMKKKRPAQEVLCWALFGRWAQKFSGYRLNPTLAGIFFAHFPKSAHEKTTLPGSFPFVGAFEPPWVPTDVQSAHFPYKLR